MVKRKNFSVTTIGTALLLIVIGWCGYAIYRVLSTTQTDPVTIRETETPSPKIVEHETQTHGTPQKTTQAQVKKQQIPQMSSQAPKLEIKKYRNLCKRFFVPTENRLLKTKEKRVEK